MQLREIVFKALGGNGQLAHPFFISSGPNQNVWKSWEHRFLKMKGKLEVEVKTIRAIQKSINQKSSEYVTL